MSILIAEDNALQRQFLADILAGEFPDHTPIIEAEDGVSATEIALRKKPDLCILDIQMPKISGVKAARQIWQQNPATRIIFWTQFPDEVYINEIRRIVRTVKPQPVYGFIHKNNPEARLLRFVATVLEDGVDMIDPAFKDAFNRPLLTEFEAEVLRYLALGLSNWAIARKCTVSMRGVESRLAALYEKLFSGASDELLTCDYEKLAYNVRTRAIFEALRRELINPGELETEDREIKNWIERDRLRFEEENRAKQ